MVKATYSHWSCPVGPSELVDYLVDPDHADEVEYDDFEEEVDVSTSPLEETQFEILDTDWAVTWLKTKLPSGMDAWVMQHSGIEYLFTEDTFDHEEESHLARIWGESQ